MINNVIKIRVLNRDFQNVKYAFNKHTSKNYTIKIYNSEFNMIDFEIVRN